MAIKGKKNVPVTIEGNSQTQAILNAQAQVVERDFANQLVGQIQQGKRIEQVVTITT